MTKPWIDAVGNHMWRFYYSRPGADPSRMSAANREQWEACNRALGRFSKAEQDIMRMYYTSEWGRDLHTAEDYSARTGTPVSRIWNTIKASNRAAAEERGLIDRM